MILLSEKSKEHKNKSNPRIKMTDYRSVAKEVRGGCKKHSALNSQRHPSNPKLGDMFPKNVNDNNVIKKE